jgi:hypothetical protein
VESYDFLIFFGALSQVMVVVADGKEVVVVQRSFVGAVLYQILKGRKKGTRDQSR